MNAHRRQLAVGGVLKVPHIKRTHALDETAVASVFIVLIKAALDGQRLPFILLHLNKQS